MPSPEGAALPLGSPGQTKAVWRRRICGLEA
jgi:hypothetical protein